MRAFVVTGPQRAAVQVVPDPEPGPGEVLVAVARVGVCGTDAEFWTGEMTYLASGHARYPVRIGHEWCGEVVDVGAGVDRSWLGRRTTGDTMLGCGRCLRCRSGRQHVCEQRSEVGIRGDRPGALAELLAVPASSLHPLPDAVDDVAGALVEPGANAMRAVQAAQAAPGTRLLVVGPGTIGLLVALLARAAGADVHLLGLTPGSLAFARSLGFTATAADAPDSPFAPGGTGEGPGFDAVVDAATDASTPSRAAELVEPGGRVVWIGLSSTPSLLDTRTMLLRDVTGVGVISGSPALARTVESYASDAVDPRPLVAATVGLDAVADVLAGGRPDGAGPGPKVHVDPRS